MSLWHMHRRVTASERAILEALMEAAPTHWLPAHTIRHKTGLTIRGYQLVTRGMEADYLVNRGERDNKPGCVLTITGKRVLDGKGQGG